MNRTLKQNQKGFTLIELLVVVAIVGILATAGIPQYRRMIAKSKQGEAKTALSDVSSAQSAFFSEFGAYGNNLRAMGVQSDIADQDGKVDADQVKSKTYLYGFIGTDCAAAGGDAVPDSGVRKDAVMASNKGYYNSYSDAIDTAGNQNKSSTVFGRVTLTGECGDNSAEPDSVIKVPSNADNFRSYRVIASGVIFPGLDPDTGSITDATDSNTDVWSVDQTRQITNQIKGLK